MNSMMMYPDYQKISRMDRCGSSMEEESKQMLLQKAGECLRYALGNELDAEDLSGVPNHLRAFIAYFTLIGKIDRKSAELLKDILSNLSTTSPEFENYYRQLTTIIIRNLKKHFHFSGTESLFSALDEITVPEWAFNSSFEILSLLPEIYLIEGKLYYIIERRGTCCLRCIRAEEASHLLRFDEEITTDATETNRTISKSYSHIIGYIAETKQFYLQFANTNEMFACYDIEKDIETVYHHRCLGLLADVFPLIECDNRLAVVISGKIQKIKEMNPCEDYIAADHEILVMPAWNSRQYFKPYKLSTEGKATTCSANELADFLTDQILNQLDLDREVTEDSLFSAIFSEEPVPIPDRKDQPFTVEFMEELLKGYHPEENKACRMYHLINSTFKKYLPEEQDVLDYWFMLADVSRKLADEPGPIFITEECYWRVFKAALDDDIEEAIKHIDTFEALLLKGKDPVRKSHVEAIRVRDKGIRLGCFQMTGNGIKAIRSDLNSARVIGSSLVPADISLPGIVSYSLDHGYHEIGTLRTLSKEEKDAIIQEFMLEGKPHRFYTDLRATPD